MKRVGFIGLGLMGGPMAANVARAGFPLAVYNRTLEKAAPLAALGATVAGNPREVAEDCDVIVTMLADATSVEAVLDGADGILKAARPGMVLIDASTVAPADSKRTGEKLAGCRMKMLDAPVMGSVGPAAEGALIFLVGGDWEVYEAQQDLLKVMGKEAHYMGPQGSGAQMKLCMNLLIAAQMVSLSESMLLAEKAGLDVKKAAGIISANMIASPLMARKVKNMVDKQFQSAFPLKHMQKDLGLILENGESLGVVLPSSKILHRLYSQAKTEGYAEGDFSGIYRLLEDLSHGAGRRAV